jgi:hypothetical protein
MLNGIRVRVGNVACWTDDRRAPLGIHARITLMYLLWVEHRTNPRHATFGFLPSGSLRSWALRWNAVGSLGIVTVFGFSIMLC